jgi:cobalt-zinc-cadmium efflux system outer membrane protein
MLRLETELADTYDRLGSAYAEASLLAGDILPQALRAYDVIREGFAQGRFDLLDVLDAQRTLAEARGTYLEALTNFHALETDIERLTGRALSTSE